MSLELSASDCCCGIVQRIVDLVSWYSPVESAEDVACVAFCTTNNSRPYID
jgi:hypothetical protein